jgi:hypothetical protein
MYASCREVRLLPRIPGVVANINSGQIQFTFIYESPRATLDSLVREYLDISLLPSSSAGLCLSALAGTCVCSCPGEERQLGVKVPIKALVSEFTHLNVPLYFHDGAESSDIPEVLFHLSDWGHKAMNYVFDLPP